MAEHRPRKLGIWVQFPPTAKFFHVFFRLPQDYLSLIIISENHYYIEGSFWIQILPKTNNGIILSPGICGLKNEGCDLFLDTSSGSQPLRLWIPMQWWEGKELFICLSISYQNIFTKKKFFFVYSTSSTPIYLYYTENIAI